MRIEKLVAGAGAFIAMTLIIAGCSDDGARQAASPLDDQEVGALFGSGTNVCIENKSTKAVPITIKKADTRTGDNPLGPGGRFCAEGTFSGGQDVVLKLDLGSGNHAMWINATNQSLGEPRFYLLQEWEYDNSNCIYQGFASMEEKVTEDAILQYAVQRMPDTDWKEFRVTLRDSTRPQRQSTRVACDQV